MFTGESTFMLQWNSKAEQYKETLALTCCLKQLKAVDPSIAIYPSTADGWQVDCEHSIALLTPTPQSYLPASSASLIFPHSTAEIGKQKSSELRAGDRADQANFSG